MACFIINNATRTFYTSLVRLGDAGTESLKRKIHFNGHNMNVCD